MRLSLKTQNGESVRVSDVAPRAIRRADAFTLYPFVEYGTQTECGPNNLDRDLARWRVFAGLLEFVPVVGAIVFSVVGILLAFAKSPLLALYAVMACLVVQQVESNIIIPLLQRWAVRLAPGITLISVVVGGLLFGLPGVVFATPMAVVV